MEFVPKKTIDRHRERSQIHHSTQTDPSTVVGVTSCFCFFQGVTLTIELRLLSIKTKVSRLTWQPARVSQALGVFSLLKDQNTP